MYKIVIADDEAMILRSLVRKISWTEHEAELAGTAENGADLMQLIEYQQPDIVITDICMPGLTGLEVIAKAEEDGKDIHFIITSAYTTFEYAREALVLGADEFLPKPFTAEEVNTAIERSLKKLRNKRDTELKQKTEEGDKSREGKGNLFVGEAISYIKTHFQESIQLTDVADAVYLSPTYFSKLFRKYTEKTFSEYLTQFRVERAREYLKNPRYSIEQVAQMCGYHDPKYFAKVFKAETGMTPNEWRHFEY